MGTVTTKTTCDQSDSQWKINDVSGSCAQMANISLNVPISPNAPDRRLLEPVSTVRAEHLVNNPLGVSAEEWKARTESAALHRMLYLYGMGSDLAAQCVMHRIPGKDEFL